MDLGAGFLDTSASSSVEKSIGNENEVSSTTPKAPVEYATLDEEIGNVMSSLGSFWGKVRKQSVVALAQANQQIDKASKDFTPLVDKARSNLAQFSESTKAELERLSEISNANDGGVMIGSDGTPIISEGITRNEKGKGREGAEENNMGMESATAFFNKLQSQISDNPSFKELGKNLGTLQANFTENLTHLPQSMNQLKLHLDLEKGEEFLHKGETWLNELAKLAKDAVKIIPPIEATAKRVELGRKDLLMRRFKKDLDILLLVDPTKPPISESLDTREAFSSFLAKIEEQGGMEGIEFEKMIQAELLISSKEEVDSVGKSLEKLSASGISREAFWSRYFFRVSQIEEEETRRREVLHAATGVEENFSWDMEDEESTPSLPVTPSTPTSAHPTNPLANAILTTPKATKVSTENQIDSTHSTVPLADQADSPKSITSPRASSDGTGSYDVVGNASGNPSEAGDAKLSDGEDSDWE